MPTTVSLPNCHDFLEPMIDFVQHTVQRDNLSRSDLTEGSTTPQQAQAMH